MATLSRGQTFGVTEQVTATKLHNLVDNATISGITTTDISASAGITAGQLAAITTANKVSGTALYNLSSLTSLAGIIPNTNISLVSIPNASLLPLSLASWVSGQSLKELASIPSGAGLMPYSNIVSSLASGAYPQYNGSTNFVGSVVTVDNANQLSSSATFTAQDPLSITQAVGADEVYRIIIEGQVNTDPTKPAIRINSASTGSYGWSTHLLTNSTEATSSSTSDTEIDLLDGTETWLAGTQFHIELLITSRNSDTQVSYVTSSFNASTPEIITSRGAGFYNAAVMSSIQLLDVNSGFNATYTGRYYIHKLKTS